MWIDSNTAQGAADKDFKTVVNGRRQNNTTNDSGKLRPVCFNLGLRSNATFVHRRPVATGMLLMSLSPSRTRQKSTVPELSKSCLHDSSLCVTLQAKCLCLRSSLYNRMDCHQLLISLNAWSLHAGNPISNRAKDTQKRPRVVP